MNTPVKINHNYLPQQFADIEEIISGIRTVVGRGDFTLGSEVADFEREFAKMCGVKHAIGVGNGTDALFLALKSLGIGRGRLGTVITSPYSFYATTAAIKSAGGYPVFVDVDNDFNIDPSKIEKAITDETVGIVLVHWAGRPCAMREILNIAKRHGLWVIEDCAHAPNAVYHGKRCGSLGDIGTFSLHPLKNVNVWGDGGVVTTDDDDIASWVRKARNHGMVDRNTVEFWGYNSRLDTIQAVVARHVLSRIYNVTQQRRKNAAILDLMLKDLDGIELPRNAPDTGPNYYLYTFHAEKRDELQKFLVGFGIDAKVHYPTPLHLQPAAQETCYLPRGYFELGDFPIAEWCAHTTISLPVHEYLTEEQLIFMGGRVRQFCEMHWMAKQYEGC